MSVNWMPVISFLFLVTIIGINHRSRKRHPPLPPGPQKDPIIGHLRSLPQENQNLYFYQLGLKYGDVVHLNIIGKSLIVLNSVQAANDLFEKRGTIYSGRPSFPIYDILGLSDTIVFVDYGPEFRAQRRMLQNYLGKKQHKKHRSVQTREARILSRSLIDKPEDMSNSFIRFATAIIVEINYGHRIQPNKDPYVEMAAECAQVAVELGPVGSTPIDLFPFLRYFPSWFPGTYYAAVARKNLHKFIKLRKYPYERVEEQLNNGAAEPSFLASQIEKLRLEGMDNASNIKQLQAASAILFISGSETTSSTISFFVLAMVLHPECQARAQEEIDRVVGSSRLPEFEDRKDLPYLECLMQEVFRWNQALPRGGPRKVLEDDIYKGMLIPKGSTIIPNVRAMTLDENVYKDPFRFDPTRFLPPPTGAGEPYPDIFGWGRRICPGRHLGEGSVWIAMATILATISISKAIGLDGAEITPDNSAIAIGITSRPTAYQCRIGPRGDAAMKLLQQVTENPSTL